MTNLTREGIVEAAKRAAAESGATFLSRNDFERLTSRRQYHIYRLFPEGGWSEVVQLAGLDHNPRHNLPVSDDDLLAALHDVSSELGRFPSGAQCNARASISGDALSKRLHGWSGTKHRYRQWLKKHGLTSPLPAPVRSASRPRAMDRTITGDASRTAFNPANRYW